jgi:hypothetical protein
VKAGALRRGPLIAGAGYTLKKALTAKAVPGTNAKAEKIRSAIPTAFHLSPFCAHGLLNSGSFP